MSEYSQPLVKDTMGDSQKSFMGHCEDLGFFLWQNENTMESLGRGLWSGFEQIASSYSVENGL